MQLEDEERPRSIGQIRLRLLTTVSAAALAASLGTPALADELDPSLSHFTLEIGGGYNWVGGPDSTYFIPGAGSDFPVKHGNGFDFEGKATFQPAASDLVFTAAVQYGRANHKGASASGSFYSGEGSYTYAGQAHHREGHLAVDFEVGRDFGLGMFGGSSIVSLGVRYAHFDAKTAISFSTSSKYFGGSGTGLIYRKFDGIGPIVSYDGSIPVSDDFSIELGADAAVLFGTQNIRSTNTGGGGPIVLEAARSDAVFGSYAGFRSRSTTVPAVGAYAAVSYHFAGPSAKVSLGYRVDSYFGVLDGGFSTHDDIDRTFHGPYLNIGLATN